MATRIDDLYETDFYAWTRTQAKALRALRETRPNAEIDWRHLIEEVEGLGREERAKIRVWTCRIIEALLQLEHCPEGADRRKWFSDIVDHRHEIDLRLSPSHRRHLQTQLLHLYRSVRDDLSRKLVLFEEREVAVRMPEMCPYTLEQVLDADWWPDS